jgi:hypothetical protein
MALLRVKGKTLLSERKATIIMARAKMAVKSDAADVEAKEMPKDMATSSKTEP